VQFLKTYVLTIAIPTFNRSGRLAKNLQHIHKEITRDNLESQVKLLISDNNSSDETHAISQMYSEKFLTSNIDFQYFKNQSNTGFSRNVLESYFRAKSDYTLFLSDDDNLNAGFLKQLLSDIERYKFSAGVYNFIQAPYDGENLLVKHSSLVLGEQALGGLASLVAWPKLSGLVLRNNHESGRFEELKNQISASNVVGHVLLAIDQIRRDPVLYVSSTVAAYPDEDYRDHINFVSYIGNYIKKDLEEYCTRVGVANTKLMLAIAGIPSRNVVLYSLQALSLFYKSQTKLSKKMKHEVISNVCRYLLGSRLSQKGLRLEAPYKSFPRIRTFVYTFYLVSLAVKARITKKKLYLMNEAF
jgi:glycosyltransferase involved in cell wall biosynthesis